MSFHAGCHGRVIVGSLPGPVQRTLAALPGDWLEFDPPSRAIVVRHIQPTDDPVLPAVTMELVRLLAAIPFEEQEKIEGGDMFVHVEDTGRLVRLRVEAGGSLHVQWARPDYAGAVRRPWSDGREIVIESWDQRLNGTVRFDPEGGAGEAAGRLVDLADSFEGLHPEGDFRVRPGEGGVTIELRDVNLDARLLVRELQSLARPRSLQGALDVGSFGELVPEKQVRVLFEKGEAWVQHPLLWS
ncbi:MAG: hypothetical protein RRA92_11405 [Gemmatimonadota bacterium]|nr:hypothetical protein [Gemmatimonadota bacterium]